MSFFETYKPGQAKASRTMNLVCGLALIIWGARALTLALPRAWTGLGESINVQFMEAAPSAAWTVDMVILESKISIALLVGAVLMLGACAWWQRFVNKPKWADLLIEMEAELRKVSWPPANDAMSSTLIVTLATVVIVILMLAYDFVIKGFLELFVSIG